MDQRAPGEDAGDAVVGGGEVLERPELVGTARVGGLGMGDELGDHVDSPGVGAQAAKVFGDVAGSAAQIEYRSRTGRQMPPDEVEVVGVYLLACPEQLDVEVRYGRVCLPNLLHAHHATVLDQVMSIWRSKVT